jgi:hypothetical protein
MSSLLGEGDSDGVINVGAGFKSDSASSQRGFNDV